jgi:hypothetical protein
MVALGDVRLIVSQASKRSRLDLNSHGNALKLQHDGLREGGSWMNAFRPIPQVTQVIADDLEDKMEIIGSRAPDVSASDTTAAGAVPGNKNCSW